MGSDLAATSVGRQAISVPRRRRYGGDEASDIELLVDLDDDVGLVALGGLERELCEFSGADVDVISASLLEPAVRESAEVEAIAL